MMFSINMGYEKNAECLEASKQVPFGAPTKENTELCTHSKS